MWLYSSDGSDENHGIDSELFASLKKVHPNIVFVAPELEHLEDDADFFCERFAAIGRANIATFAADHIQDQMRIRDVFNSDLIYLGGGNTYYLMHYLRRSRFGELILQYIKEGGVLAGSSAGAIVMTPTIGTAGFPSFDRDENTVGLKSNQGLGLVGFEVFPHYTHEPRYIRELKEYAEKLTHPLYAIPDGGCIRVDRGRLVVYGDCRIYVDGQHCRLMPY